jgi:hypothetical protein
MAIAGPGREQLRTLAQRLRDAGTEGQGLRRELMKQLDEAAKPLAREIASVAHLNPYLPDRYAAVLAADLSVRVQKLFGASARISVVAKARAHRRKLAILEDGRINHPVFAEGPRRGWEWVNGQTAGMRPRFFADPCERAVPDIRDHMAEAMAETARRITS